jgi:SprT-like protein
MNVSYELVAGCLYTWDSGDSKFFIFVKSIDDNEGICSTLVANDGDLYEREYNVGFFKTENVRFSYFDERKEFLSLNPFQEPWLEQTIETLVKKHWNTSNRPSITLDPVERIGIEFLGAYDAPTESLVFHSGMIALLSEEEMKMVVLHELCHWYLHITGEAYLDEDIRFAEEIIRVGADETINFHRENAKHAYEQAKLSK